METNMFNRALMDIAGDDGVFKPLADVPKPKFILPKLEDVTAAKHQLEIRGVKRTRLVKLEQAMYLTNQEETCLQPTPIEIYLKLECEQICRTFKTRGAINYVANTDPALLKHGVITPSVGSFGQGLAHISKHHPDIIPTCTVLLPDQMDRYRAELLEEQGANVRILPFFDWWFALENRMLPPSFGVDDPLRKAHFIHPASTECSAGDATIALEILEELPDVDSIVVPFCTGGFSAGVSHVVNQINPKVKVFAAEVNSSTPLRTAMDNGNPKRCNHTASFVDQIGGENVLPFMWDPIKKSGVEGSLVVNQEQIVNAIQTIINEVGVVAEGAGATPLAAAMAGKAGAGKICCVVTGGNIDAAFMDQVMRGQVPQPRF